MADSSKEPAGPPPEYDKATSRRSMMPPGPRRGPRPLELPILSYLNSKRVILASASPRRKALLQQVGLRNLEILPSTKPEDLDKTAYGPYEYVAATGRRKCLDVYSAALETHLKSIPDPSLVIAADTVIVTRDGRILEKPRNEAEHLRMLRTMRDTRVHKVLTSVTVVAPREDARHPGYDIATHTEETKVYFWAEDDGLPDDVVEAYVKTREGADKAGGYAIQGIGGMLLVEKIEGSVDNVVGLPVRKTLAMAEKVIFQQDEEEVADSRAAMLSPQNPDGGAPGGGGDDKPRLTEEEKKQNHIASEQKRRQAIREGFDRLTHLVPGLEGQGRSEGLVLNKTVEFMREKMEERRQMIARIEAAGGTVDEELKKPLYNYKPRDESGGNEGSRGN
ncbi:septum formation protein [Geosmithia morbida]|uniref:Septum formation protein n=1 Tax=Geosmithia morbida TaxID=1094350 RepID=A0A9P4Z0I3_9HYPO|nr:septum formation protein [Geosmithia morbida]KAF4125038.1 septum formation protein [Geosmithia morbida]